MQRPRARTGVEHRHLEPPSCARSRDDEQRRAVTEKVLACAESLGFRRLGVLDSPVPGQKGNREILLGLTWSGGRSGRHPA